MNKEINSFFKNILLLGLSFVLLISQLYGAEEGKLPGRRNQTVTAPQGVNTITGIQQKSDKKDDNTNVEDIDKSIYNNNKTIIPETAVFVELSNSDVNRLVCSTSVKDVIYSKEKGVIVKIVDNNVFIKFLTIKEGKKEKKADTPMDFFVVCGNAVYNIIGVPKSIPSQIIRLGGDTSKKVEMNIELFQSMPYEKKITKIIKEVYLNTIPDSYTIEHKSLVIPLFKYLEVRLLRQIKVDGEGILVKEYSVKNIGDKNYELKETDFLDQAFGSSISAITIAEPLLKPNETTRLIVVTFESQKGVLYE